MMKSENKNSSGAFLLLLLWVASCNSILVLAFVSSPLQNAASNKYDGSSSSSNSIQRMATNDESCYIGSLDQGTSSTRFVIFDSSSGDIVSTAQKEHKQYYPHPGWVENDADEIWSNSVDVITQAMTHAKLQPNDIVSIGITNQRETTILWDKTTGKPFHHAIVWNCARTSELVSEYQSRLGGVDALREKTGLPLSTYFSATKLRWLLDHMPELQEHVNNDNVLFGTVDCWLAWKLTGGTVHATDVTNAARTLLCDIGTLQWDDELLEIFDIPANILPTIEPSIGGNFGTVENDACPALEGVPIGAILGDQHAATFGQACFEVGNAKSTFGTGAFIMMNTGSIGGDARPNVSKQGLLTTPFYQKKGEPAVYALEGAVAVAGSLVQWLRDNLELGSSATEIAKLAGSVKNSEGVRFVPAFAGLFAPYWRSDARGTIVGLTAYHTKAHLARAAIDATAYQTADVFDAMQVDSEIQLQELKVDGGMTANDELVQFLADLLGIVVKKPKILETTAAGVAFAAGWSAGVWSSLDEIADLWKEDSKIVPNLSSSKRQELKHTWKKAIDRSMGWVDEDEDDEE